MLYTVCIYIYIHIPMAHYILLCFHITSPVHPHHDLFFASRIHMRLVAAFVPCGTGYCGIAEEGGDKDSGVRGAQLQKLLNLSNQDKCWKSDSELSHNLPHTGEINHQNTCGL